MYMYIPVPGETEVGPTAEVIQHTMPAQLVTTYKTIEEEQI